MHALRQKASVPGKMAAKSFASRLGASRRFLRGFVAGAVAGAASTGLVVLQFLRSRDAEPAAAAREPDGECVGPRISSPGWSLGREPYPRTPQSPLAQRLAARCPVSWFCLRSVYLLPAGLSAPQVLIPTRVSTGF